MRRVASFAEQRLSPRCRANKTGKAIARRFHYVSGIRAVGDCKRDASENDNAGKKSDTFFDNHDGILNF